MKVTSEYNDRQKTNKQEIKRWIDNAKSKPEVRKNV